MSSLVIYSSHSRQKQTVVPLKPNTLGLYVCGMTVYDYCHIGHARVMVSFDVLVRFLRSQNWQVNYVRNITDIDDKIIARANENNETISELTTRFIDAMHEDADLLGCLRPDTSPKATEHIDDMLNMIGTLVDKNHAYAVDNGDVYYSVNSFEGYGKLSNRKLDDMQAGARVEVDGGKRDPMDFVLWKKAKPSEPHWESPWGVGRPGWHIECSAMSTCCLGNHFDIHGGGGDLLFPHHENEIAQAEAATGEQYVNTWMHVGFVNVDGEKMSKSLGNFFTIREVLAQFAPEVIRYFIVSSHYRSPINFSDIALTEAYNSLARLYTAVKLADEALADGTVGELSASTQTQIEALKGRFVNAMLDDINTPEAMAVLFEIVRELNRLSAQVTKDAAAINAYKAALVELADCLGLLKQDPVTFLQLGSAGSANGVSNADIEQLIADRNTAKQNKDYARADAIRQQLTDLGVVIEDSKAGTTWRRG